MCLSLADGESELVQHQPKSHDSHDSDIPIACNRVGRSENIGSLNHVRAIPSLTRRGADASGSLRGTHSQREFRGDVTCLRIFGIGYLRGWMVYDLLLEAGWDVEVEGKPKVRRLQLIGRDRCFEVSSVQSMREEVLERLESLGRRHGFRVVRWTPRPSKPWRRVECEVPRCVWMFGTCNVCTARNGVELIERVCVEKGLDVCCVQETRRKRWMDAWVSDVFVVVESRPGVLGGGVRGMATLVKRELQPQVLSKPTHNEIWLSVKNGRRKMVVGNVYVPTRNVPSRGRVLRSVVKRVKYLCERHPEDDLVVMGDFNMTVDEMGKWLRRCVLPLTPAKLPEGWCTYHQGGRRTVVDYVLVYQGSGLKWGSVGLMDMGSDHNGIVTELIGWSEERRGVSPRVSRKVVEAMFGDCLRDEEFHAFVEEGKKDGEQFVEVVREKLLDPLFRMRKKRKKRLPHALEKELKKARSLRRRVIDGELDGKRAKEAAVAMKVARASLQRYREVEKLKVLKRGIGVMLGSESKNLWKWIATKLGKRRRLCLSCMVDPRSGRVEMDLRMLCALWYEWFDGLVKVERCSDLGVAQSLAEELRKHAERRCGATRKDGARIVEVSMDGVVSDGTAVCDGQCECDCVNGVPSVMETARMPESGSAVLWGEIKRVVNGMKRGRACGVDGIPIEVYKTLVEKDPVGETDAAIALRRSVVGLLEGRIPEAVNTSILVPVYKGGSRMLFASYRDVHVLTCLLQIACALVASQLRRRLLCEGCVHEGFGGFGKRSNPVSQAMTAWEVLSMWLKEKDKCYMCVVNYKDAYHHVKLDLLMELLKKVGVEEGVVRFVRSLYESARYRVRVCGELSESHAWKGGLRQGCPLSPVLFDLYMMAMLSSLRNGDKRVCLLYGDTVCVCTKTRKKMKKALRELDEKGAVFGMVVNGRKSCVMRVAKEKKREDRPLYLNNEVLPWVDRLMYMGLLFTSTLDCKEMMLERRERVKRHRKAMHPFLVDPHIPSSMRMRVLEKVLLPVALYGCEIWGHSKQTVGMVTTKVIKGLRLVVMGRKGDSLSNSVLLAELGIRDVWSLVVGRRLQVGWKQWGYPLEERIRAIKDGENTGTYLKLVAKWGYGLMKKYGCLEGMELNKRRLSDAFWDFMDKETISKAVKGEWNGYLESGPEVSGYTAYKKVKGPMRQVYQDVWDDKPELWRGCQTLLKIRVNGFYSGEKLLQVKHWSDCGCPCCGDKSEMETTVHYLLECPCWWEEREVMRVEIEELMDMHDVVIQSMERVVLMIAGIESDYSAYEEALVFPSRRFPNHKGSAIESLLQEELIEVDDDLYAFFYGCTVALCRFLNATYSMRQWRVKEWLFHDRMVDRMRRAVTCPVPISMASYFGGSGCVMLKTVRCGRGSSQSSDESGGDGDGDESGGDGDESSGDGDESGGDGDGDESDDDESDDDASDSDGDESDSDASDSDGDDDASDSDGDVASSDTIYISDPSSDEAVGDKQNGGESEVSKKRSMDREDWMEKRRNLQQSADKSSRVDCEEIVYSASTEEDSASTVIISDDSSEEDVYYSATSSSDRSVVSDD